jgi:hypothetical protein
MRHILLLLFMAIPVNITFAEERSESPPAYLIYSGVGTSAQGTAVSLRVYKNYGWFITASHVLKGPSSVIIENRRYPLQVMDTFRTSGMIPDGLTIMRTVSKIPHDDLNTRLMDTGRTPKVGDKVWLLGYPSGTFQSRRTYITELIQNQFLTRSYLSFGASGGLVVYEDGSLAGIIHGFADGQAREGIHSNIVLFAANIQENYPFLIPRPRSDRDKSDRDKIALHDKDANSVCDCGCEGCKDCNVGECPCDSGCNCEDNCPCRIRRTIPDTDSNAAPLPPDQNGPIVEGPSEDSKPDVPIRLEENIADKSDREYIDEQIKSMREEIINLIKDNAVCVPPVATTPEIEPPVVEPPVEPIQEATPELPPEPPLVIPEATPQEKENVGVLGSLIDKAGWILPIVGVAVPGGALGWLGMQGVLSLLRRRKRRRKEEEAGSIPPLFRRDVSEAEQIIGLRQSEQREPIFDTMRGILFEDEFNSNPDQSFKEAVATVDSKFNKIVPVATQHTTLDTK